MLFIFKKKKHILGGRNSGIQAPSRKKFNLLILTTDLDLIKNQILPIYLITNKIGLFFFYYKFQTLRDIYLFKKYLKYYFVKKKLQAIILPSKN